MAIQLRIAAANLLELLEAGKFLGTIRAGPVVGAIQNRQVFEHTRIVQNGGESTRVRVGLVAWRVREERVQRRVLRQAMPQLLEVVDAACLAHS